MLRTVLSLGVVLVASLLANACASQQPAYAPPSPDAHAHPTVDAIDAEVARAMAATGAKGLALAVIDGGRVSSVKAYGLRNAKGEPLQADTVMYGASLTKVVFAYAVMQLVDEGKLALDHPIGELLDKPLPDYPDDDKYSTWSDLADDPRWRKITPRMVLTHSTGFANFGFLEPDHKLRIHFEPGSRYSYSGDGMILLQFAIERGLGLDIGELTQQRVFDRLGMPDSSLQWRPDFAANLADGWKLDGSVEPHDERSAPRAAGSMDTSIHDLSRFVAALVRGDGLSHASAKAMTTPQLPITVRSQFPVLQDELPPAQRRVDFAAGLGLLVFDGPQGPAFARGGHNDSTGNMMVCLQRTQRCVLILSNDVRAEAAFPQLVRFVLGQTDAPWTFLLGDLKFWDGT